MQTIDILLAAYRPNMAYLEAQLRSLEAQEYPAARLLLLQDGNDPEICEEIQALAGRVLQRLPYSIQCNHENMGSSATFERLTGMAEADHVAYCDQDDIWQPGKLAALSALLEANAGATLGYSNMSIIDAAGKPLYPTLQAMRGRFAHLSGPGLFPYFLTDNCVTGMTILMPRHVAQAAMPFPAAYVHDNWLALCAAASGDIAYSPEPLVQYRLHGDNQIGMASLSGVTDRESYLSERLLPLQAMLDSPALGRFTAPGQRREIARQRQGLEARLRLMRTRRGWPAVARLGWRDPVRMAFETLLALLPRGMGEGLVRFAQRH